MGFEIDSFAVAAQDRSLRGVGIVRADGAVGVRDGIWGVGICTQRPRKTPLPQTCAEALEQTIGRAMVATRRMVLISCFGGVG